MMGMKGLASAMKPKGPMAAGGPAEEAAEGETEDSGSELKFFQLASEASAAGDHEAAAKALQSGVKACMSSYGSKP